MKVPIGSGAGGSRRSGFCFPGIVRQARQAVTGSQATGIVFPGKLKDANQCQDCGGVSRFRREPMLTLFASASLQEDDGWEATEFAVVGRSKMRRTRGEVWRATQGRVRAGCRLQLPYGV